LLNILICQRLLWRIKLNSNNQATTLFALHYILTIEFCNIMGVMGKRRVGGRVKWFQGLPPQSKIVSENYFFVLFVGSGENTATSRAAICQLDADTGPCEGDLKRWYFSTQRSTCVPFIYSGCAGNR
jgi:hypothetical protein